MMNIFNLDVGIPCEATVYVDFSLCEGLEVAEYAFNPILFILGLSSDENDCSNISFESL